MEIDPTLLEKVQGENEEFKKLYQEHLDLKHRVEELNKMNFLSPEQELEKKTVQKLKILYVLLLKRQLKSSKKQQTQNL